eukprot:2004120-Rhodomonas_salina.1
MRCPVLIYAGLVLVSFYLPAAYFPTILLPVLTWALLLPGKGGASEVLLKLSCTVEHLPTARCYHSSRTVLCTVCDNRVKASPPGLSSLAWVPNQPSRKTTTRIPFRHFRLVFSFKFRMGSRDYILTVSSVTSATDAAAAAARGVGSSFASTGGGGGAGAGAGAGGSELDVRTLVPMCERERKREKEWRERVSVSRVCLKNAFMSFTSNSNTTNNTVKTVQTSDHKTIADPNNDTSLRKRSLQDVKEVAGSLEITVSKLAHLPKMDGLLSGGKCDPYVILELGENRDAVVVVVVLVVVVDGG